MYQKTKIIRKNISISKIMIERISAIPSIHSLPSDLVMDIIERVAAHSLKDVISVKLSCRKLNELIDDCYVYKHASFPDFPEWKELGTNPRIEFREGVACLYYKSARPESEEKKRRRYLFLQKCVDAGNPQALYWRGLVDYFEGKEPEHAIGYLKKAANAGNVAAQYAISIISIFSGGKEDKKNGIIDLSRIMEKEWRRDVRTARWQLMNIFFLRRPARNSAIRKLNPKPVCCTITGHIYPAAGLLGAADGDNEEVECLSCRCDLEISYINSILPFAGVVEWAAASEEFSYGPYNFFKTP